MKIEVAGAGAGKTTKMASRVLSIDIPNGKIVYCVAFTNAAADNIKAKLVELNGFVPGNVKVSTIHSFLYTEFVQPYYRLLYDIRYQKISVIGLPDDFRYRNARIRELEGRGLLHQAVIPQKAKWVVDKRSKDNAQIKALRDKVLSLFAGYCHGIIIDEAQDIDKDIRDVLLSLNRSGINIELSGDPKQDVKGYGCFREVISMFPDDVSYSNECHRCPQMHLQISNHLACENEKQVADENTCEGSIDVLFESETNVAALVEDRDYGLAYISKKNDRYYTHAMVAEGKRFDALRHELDMAIRDKHETGMSDLEVKRAAYYAAGQMIAFVDGGGEVGTAISQGIDCGYYNYDNKSYARLADALNAADIPEDGKIVVSSIEAIKGLEHERCLFVLTRDLAPYLIGGRTDDNKIKHLLYVALTRSLDNLTVLVTTEVEGLYTRGQIMAALGKTPM